MAAAVLHAAAITLSAREYPAPADYVRLIGLGLVDHARERSGSQTSVIFAYSRQLPPCRLALQVRKSSAFNSAASSFSMLRVVKRCLTSDSRI